MTYFDLEALGVVRDHSPTEAEHAEAERSVGDLVREFGFRLLSQEGPYRLEDLRDGKVTEELYGLAEVVDWMAAEAGVASAA